MIPSNKRIANMKTLCRKTGRELTDQEAFEAAFSLLNLFEILLQVDKRIHPEDYKRREE